MRATNLILRGILETLIRSIFNVIGEIVALTSVRNTLKQVRRFKLENWFQHLEVGGVGGGRTRKQTKKLSILTVIIFKTGEGLREAGGGCKGTEMSIT